MRFEQTRPLFMQMTESEQVEFFAAYRQRRDQAIIDSFQKKSKARAAKEPKIAMPAIVLTDKEKEVMKLLGLNAKGIAALRRIS